VTQAAPRVERSMPAYMGGADAVAHHVAHRD